MSKGTAGFRVTPEMRRLLTKPTPHTIEEGGQRLRTLYQQNSVDFDVFLYNEFPFWCFTGDLERVMQAVARGSAPDLSGVETPYEFGYATIIVTGAQRIQGPPRGAKVNHAAVLKFLISRGLPVDKPDIVGYTALAHATMALPRADLARILLENGADPNHGDRWGTVPLIGAFQNNALDAIDVLLEFGADLTLEDADGCAPDPFFVQCGAQVTALVQKWKRRRAGETAAMDEKKCAACRRTDVTLKFCAKCHAARYCSTACQRSDWKAHKLVCLPFNAENTITLRPRYHAGGMFTMSMADMARQLNGQPVASQPARTSRGAPKLRDEATKWMVIKVQVPYNLQAAGPSAAQAGNLMVYNKKRDFACSIVKADNPAAYMRISEVVRSQGVGGAKAYFVAELKSEDELVVKVGEVLAEQPF